MQNSREEFSVSAVVKTVILSSIVSYLTVLMILLASSFAISYIPRYESLYGYLAVAMQFILGLVSGVVSSRKVKRYLLLVGGMQFVAVVLISIFTSLVLRGKSFSLLDLISGSLIILAATFIGVFASVPKAKKQM